MAIKKSVRLVDETIKVCHELTQTGDTNFRSRWWPKSFSAFYAAVHVTPVAAYVSRVTKHHKVVLTTGRVLRQNLKGYLIFKERFTNFKNT